MTNYTLNQTIPVGQQWSFRVEDGSQYTIESSSNKLLYQLTNNNLIIIADKDAEDGAYITLTNDPVVIKYTLNKENVPENIVSDITIYKGTSREFPNNYTSGTIEQFNKTPFEVYVQGNKRFIWIAIPNDLSISNVVDTTLNQSQTSSFVNVSVGDYELYYFNTNLNNPNTTYKFMIQ